MTREINLEYEVKLMCKNFSEDLTRQKEEEDRKAAPVISMKVTVPKPQKPKVKNLRVTRKNPL